MRKWAVLLILIAVAAGSAAFTHYEATVENLRKIYSRPPAEWPAPNVDSGVSWLELGPLPAPHALTDSLRRIAELGKVLFFDTRLSGSGMISCATCHQPELSWADGKQRSVGHANATNKRNAPSLQNVWFYSKLFWDGRSHNLEDQAFAPINSESEMAGDMRMLPATLRRIEGYKKLFTEAYGDPAVDPDRIAAALATFQRTIVSRKSRFDEFLEGDKKALSNSELRGLHVFRTKAGCMNCHNGPMFSDNRFNKGIAGFGGSEDKGLYNVTHVEADLRKFKTPSLRDVTKTAPWLHDGSANSLLQIITLYEKSSPRPAGYFVPVQLSKYDKKDLLAFLNAISSPPLEFDKPLMPQ